MTLKALVIGQTDNVANLIGPGKKGQVVECRTEGKDQTVKIELLNDLPANHKLAFRDVKKDEPIIKYDLQIGVASQDIKQGEHVHDHNVDSTRGRGDLTTDAAVATA